MTAPFHWLNDPFVALKSQVIPFVPNPVFFSGWMSIQTKLQFLKIVFMRGVKIKIHIPQSFRSASTSFFHGWFAQPKRGQRTVVSFGRKINKNFICSIRNHFNHNIRLAKGRSDERQCKWYKCHVYPYLGNKNIIRLSFSYSKVTERNDHYRVGDKNPCTHTSRGVE